MPKLFLYWENRDGCTRPPYLDMCLDTINAHFGQDFDIVVLTPSNISDYIPSIHPNWHHLKVLAHKADIVRTAVLYHNGGFWLDFDTIALRPASHWLRKLDDVEIVWGSEQCFGAKDHSPFLADVLAIQDAKLDENRDEYEWTELGLTGSIAPVMERHLREQRLSIWRIPLPEISTIPPLTWEHDSGRSGFMGQIKLDAFFNPKQVVVRLHNQLYSNWIKQMDAYQHATSNTLFSQFVMKSLIDAGRSHVWDAYLGGRYRSLFRRAKARLKPRFVRGE